MFQPSELKTDEPLIWSTGTGNQVWNMFCYCRDGNRNAVENTLNAFPGLVDCSHAYLTPLFFAVSNNQIETTQLLLDRGANPAGFSVGDSLWQLAKKRGYVDIEKMLHDRIFGPDRSVEAGEMLGQIIRDQNLSRLRSILTDHPEWIDARDERTNQPIHWATMTRQPQFIDELLDRGADIEAKRLDGARPMQLFNGDYHFRGWSRVPRDWMHTPEDILGHLISRGANVDLCSACHMGNIARVQELIDRDPSCVNRLSDSVTYYLGSGSPVGNASTAGHIEIVRLLLEHGADPNLREPGIAPFGKALYSAIAEQHLEIAELLLLAGANPNAPVESSADALSRAIMNKDEKAIDLLCSYGASRPVHILAYYGDLKTAAAVFSANPKLADDVEALANAAGEGQDAFVRLMLRFCPDLPSRLEFPSWLAAAKNRVTTQLLFEHGMNPNQANWLGVRPLHNIAIKGDVELAKIYVEQGADFDVIDDCSMAPPLGWAAREGQLEMVKYLLSVGARRNWSDLPEWAQPVTLARLSGHPEIEALLV
jgi:ankyrin repeat protein